MPLQEKVNEAHRILAPITDAMREQALARGATLGTDPDRVAQVQQMAQHLATRQGRREIQAVAQIAPMLARHVVARETPHAGGRTGYDDDSDDLQQITPLGDIFEDAL